MLLHPQLLDHAPEEIVLRVESLKQTFKDWKSWVAVLQHKPHLFWTPLKDLTAASSVLQQHGLDPSRYIRAVACGAQNARIDPQLLQDNISHVLELLSKARSKQTLK